MNYNIIQQIKTEIRELDILFLYLANHFDNEFGFGKVRLY